MTNKTYIFYYHPRLTDGDVVKIKASNIREALKSLNEFFFKSGLEPKDTYLSFHYQLYSNGKFSRRKLNDKHYRYLSAWIIKLVDIGFYKRFSDD